MSWIEKLEQAFIIDLREALDLARLVGNLVDVDVITKLLASLESNAPLDENMIPTFINRFTLWIDASQQRREIWNDNDFTIKRIIARRHYCP